jgi:HEAT repeat protein
MQESESVDSKVYLAVTLWQIGDRDAEVASAISAFLGQRHAFFLSTPRVMGFLRRCQVHEFIPELIQSLTHSESGDFIGMAAQTLGEFGEAARGAIPNLEQLATGGTQYARLCAAVALHRIDPSSSIAVPALVEMVAGPRKVIESYDDEGLLRLMMRTTEPRDRARAAAALGELGPAAQSALPALRLAALEEDEKLRTAALTAIENIERA